MSDREPWLPPGHAERLVVGARVRVTVSAECNAVPRWCVNADGVLGEIVTRVTDHGYPPTSDAHDYCIRFIGRGFNGVRPTCMQWFAASELEPLDDAP